MKFSELFKKENSNMQNAFILGMIYARPILLKKRKILGYSAYRKGDRSEQLKGDINKYYGIHKKKLEFFLGHTYEVILNKDIKNSDLENDIERIQSGVSVVLDNDLIIPKEVNSKIYIYGLIEKWLIDAKEEHKKFFLIGTLDARGSLDFTGKFITLDIIEETPILVKRKLSKYNDIIGAVFNYNPRLTQENSFTKNDQFRLPLFYYMGNFGLFTPFKIDYYRSEIKNNKGINKLEFFFLDDQYKDIEIPESISERNLKINNLAIKLQKDNLTNDQKRIIIEEWKEENFNLDTDDEIMFSSQNMKELSKKTSNYLCEYDNNHITFNAKTNNKNYVEAHHLIPFSERKKFVVSIDITENIICLCPNCHRKIHLALDSERKDFISSLFKSRKDRLKKAGVNSDLDAMFEYYRIEK